MGPRRRATPQGRALLRAGSVPAAARAAAAAAAGRRRPKLGCDDPVPCVAKTENCFCTFAPPQSGQDGVSPFRTSSSKCDSHFMQTYS